MRIIFAGTPEISAAVLGSLINQQYYIVACLTQPDKPQGRGLQLIPSPVKKLCLEHDIPVLQPNSLKNEEIQQQLRSLKADLMIVLAYGLILPAEILQLPKFGCINIHASILPRWRGAAPIQHAILAGDSETGITIMQMDSGLDTGAILATYPCEISPNDNSSDLLQKLTALASTAILDSLPKIAKHQLHPQTQDDKYATYAHKISKSQAKINWQDSCVQIDRIIRAYNPWPMAYTQLGEIIVRVWQAYISDQTIQADIPGTILKIDKKGIYVATVDGVLCISQLQFPGKKAISGLDINNTNYIKAGNIFN